MGEIMQEEGAWKDTLKTGTNTDTKHTLELSQYCPSFKTREDMSENIIDVLEQIDQESNFLNAEIEESTASKETAHLQTKVVPDIYKQDKAGTLTTMTTTMCGTSQFQKTPTQHYGEHLECEQETSNPINPSVRKLNCEHQTKIIAKAHDAQKSLPEDLSPLADFILLRSKQLTITSPMVEVESSNSNNVNVESKVENHPIQMRKNNVTIEHLYIQADQQRTSTVIEVQASESQCRGYCMLHDVAVSVQTQLKDIGTDYNLMGNFAMLSFDKTRWFLKQHEKKVNNNMKEVPYVTAVFAVFFFRRAIIEMGALGHMTLCTFDLLAVLLMDVSAHVL
ncbi:protein shortage in chiasmata 1 ortholog-like [Polypterus senegalus]|uniref:protein shortage in chiasmata 1 ortholog-like n=1 Tax=Polypterus senegalus TaxID=55291 RepID=UPI0019664825|nr:protein shortage in chiasmata 1 ortholog-like [Polypterus senegalus]